MSTLVLVGGTGTLGQAILRHQEILKNHGINRIRIVSRDEQKQEALEKNYKGSIPIRCYLGDCRSLHRMELAIKNADYVIHMAALKMIDRFEKDVPEGYQTNIFGSENVMRACLKENVKSTILVSTDKAINPINSYGVSKLAASYLWLWANQFQSKTKFGICLYGNVFGSRGSVIETWTKLAKEKQILPITDEKMTRFFISQNDAAQFVLQSLFHNEKKVMFPDMKATSMVRLAQVIAQSYENNEFIYKVVGLRAGEKLHEDLPHMNSLTAPQFKTEELEQMYQEYLSL